MQIVDPQWLLLRTQLLNMFLIIGWICLAIQALLQFRQRSMAEAVRFGWAALIVIIPIMGVLAFFLVSLRETPERS